MYTFFKKPKCYSGHAECNFDNPAEKVSLKIRKTIKIIIFFKNVSPENFSGQVECSLTDLPKNCLSKSALFECGPIIFDSFLCDTNWKTKLILVKFTKFVILEPFLPTCRVKCLKFSQAQRGNYVLSHTKF